MECLRVKLYTPTGIFKNPLSIKGIEVYPLPPYSTVIGLIYRAIGRKWQGEHFQISVQGDYEAIYRDYVWFKKHNFKDKELEKLPLQVPILYNLKLLIHIRAEEDLVREIENALKAPKELLFLSGGEYPVKIEEVKRVFCEERRIPEDDAVELKYNAYLLTHCLRNISTTDKGVLFNLSYFYENLQKPKVYSWIDVYYFQKGTVIYGDIIFDEDKNPVFLTYSLKETPVKPKSEEYVRFYASNWLVASACVGVLKVLENHGEDIEKFVEEKTLKIPISLWGSIPEIYADYLIGDIELAKNALETAYKQKKKKEDFNPYNTLIYSKLNDFHSNSPFTNQAHEYIRRLKGVYSEDTHEVLKLVKESFLEAYQKFLGSGKETSSLCYFCHEREAKNFVDATTFTPLFASLETVRNFIWDPIPVCKECEFLLYFTAVGFYKSGKKYLFVYIPDDLLETYRLNLVFSMEEEIEQEKLGRMWKVIEHILKIEEQKSRWILQNIYFVEIEMVGDAKANIYSFHISPTLAKAIRSLIYKYPKNLQSIFFDFLFYIYTGRSLYEFLLYFLSGFTKKDTYKNLDANTIESRIVQAGRNSEYIGKNLLFFINFQEVLNMNEPKNYINWAFWAGRELKELYSQNENTRKKLEPLTYRLLEAVRRKDKEYFIHNLIRAYLEVEKEIPYIFKEALEDKNFSMIAYSFIIGLNSEKRNKEGHIEENDEG